MRRPLLNQCEGKNTSQKKFDYVYVVYSIIFKILNK